MLNNPQEIADITFIGSGIATGYTLLELIGKLGEQPTGRITTVRVYDKYPEFFSGIPYGHRSGDSVLLINALHNFLPQPERSVFINWLEANIKPLIKGFLEAGGEKAKDWVTDNREAIEKGDWNPLFIPRSFFGRYIHEKVTEAIRNAEEKGYLKIHSTVDEVVDVEKEGKGFKLVHKDGQFSYAKKVVLSVGSLPTRKIYSEALHVQEESFLLINDIYNQDLGSNIAMIEGFLAKRKGQETNALIVGANASGLETIYKLRDEARIGTAISKFVVLSTNGLIPDSEADKEKQTKFSPINLNALDRRNQLTASEIAEAAFKDLKIAEDMELGAASTVDIISSGFGRLLSKLDTEELAKFACYHGNEIGRLQRCAGTHYTGVVDELKQGGKFHHLAGRFKTLSPTEDGGVSLHYLDTETQQAMTYPEDIHIVVNCIGSTKFTALDTVPEIFRNLFEKGICTPNASQIGIHVNQSFEASENFYVAGPMLAGNVIKNKPLWHLEHCGRIIWTSGLLAAKLYDHLPVARFSPVRKITEKEEWQAFLNRAELVDWYHTYDYHFLSKKEEEEAVLYAYENENQLIGIPLLIRNIPGSNYRDATSVYGYTGPVYKNIGPDFDNSEFRNHLLEILKEDRIISVFTRLHPFLDQQSKILQNLGRIDCKGKVVNINLRLCLDEQRRQYQRRLKTYVNKARRSCEILRAQTEQELECFKKIYFENMERVNASEFYFFEDRYFAGIAKSDQFETETLLARDIESGVVIAGCMFVKLHPFIQYHLSGMKETHQHLMPTKLLIDYMRIKGTEQGYQYFNLGGGLSGSSDDSLFQFKASFSKDFYAFCLWKWIVIPEAYDVVCQEMNRSGKEDYFPAYRS